MAHQHDQHGNPSYLPDYIARMEDPARAEWQKPEEIFAAMGISPAMTIADVGCGPGFFTRRLARRTRRVFAVDVEREMLEVLRERVATDRIANVESILASDDDPGLPRASCDRILVVNVFHHVRDRAGWLAKLAEALAPGGAIFNVDYVKRDTPLGPPLEHRLAPEEFVAVAKTAGLAARVVDSVALPWQYVVEVTR